MFAHRTFTPLIHVLARGAPSCFFSAVLLIAVTALGRPDTSSQNAIIQFSGTLSQSATDVIGLFGPAGGDLSNKPFSVTISYDLSTCTLYDPNNPPNYFCILIATITINGISKTYTLPGAGGAITLVDNSGSFKGMIEYVTDGNTNGVYNYTYFDLLYSLPKGYSPTLQNPISPLPGSPVTISLADIHGELYDNLYGIVTNIQIVSPFLLSNTDANLSDLNINTILGDSLNLAGAAATALAADNTSAAILIFKTNSSSDVTFTTNNGTSLFDYNAKFLQKVPSKAPGSSTLTVSPIKLGTLFYAVALVQAPAAGVTPNYSTQIAITAQQEGGVVQQASLPLVPPPVLLVHGLWSDETALSSYQSQLTSEAPWSNHPELIYPMVYSGDIAFDNPEFIGSMDTEVGYLIGQMQDEGIVGARVDIVAHSMGGLIARSYSNNAAYRSIEDRRQGQFHTIVTLDTPELGSQLAQYLLKHQNSTIAKSAENSIDPHAVWVQFCGTSNISITVAQCFSHQNKPVLSGAVASLVPNNEALEGAPSPHIADATWRAITATDTGGILQLEHTILSTLIEAIEFSSPHIPTLTDILQGPNDDIVSLSSQLGFEPPVHVTDKGLAHSALFGVDAAVTNSPTAIAQAACWLNDPASPACKTVSRATRVDAQASARLTIGRLVVDNVPATGIVGQALALGVQTVPYVHSFEVEQFNANGDSASDLITLPSPLWNGSTLMIKPRVVGDVTVRISAKFSDGGADFTTARLNANLDPASVVELRAHPGFSKFAAHTLPTHSGMQFRLSPAAFVYGLEQPVKIATLAKYTIASPGPDPAVSVDEHGLVHALHPGTAVIEVSFAGHTDQVTVVVRQSGE